MALARRPVCLELCRFFQGMRILPFTLVRNVKSIPELEDLLLTPAVAAHHSAICYSFSKSMHTSEYGAED